MMPCLLGFMGEWMYWSVLEAIEYFGLHFLQIRENFYVPLCRNSVLGYWCSESNSFKRNQPSSFQHFLAYSHSQKDGSHHC